ncbi:hypothetical protein AB4Z40_08945 [Bosea sp. 2YAB26]|uniref:hypothetical protein n=1 Tax=Bosea sp. 2YAB26 TaxID=3237478 RepID=UPI003F8DBDA8
MAEKLTANHAQRVLALFPRKPRSTERGKLLDALLRLRCQSAWVTRGCYAWWRHVGYVEAAQKELVKFRATRRALEDRT